LLPFSLQRKRTATILRKSLANQARLGPKTIAVK